MGRPQRPCRMQQTRVVADTTRGMCRVSGSTDNKAQLGARHLRVTTGTTGHVPVATPQITAATDLLQRAMQTLLEAQAPRSQATLGELVEAWLASTGPLRTAATLRGYRSDTASVLAHVDAPIMELRASDLECAIDKLPSGRWNAVTLCWRALLRWGELHGYPGASLLLPRARRFKSHRHAHGEHVWRRAVLELAVAYRDADPRSKVVAGATLLAVTCGVRRLPCARMRWTEVDLAKGMWQCTDKTKDRVVELGPIAWPLVASQPRRGEWVWPARKGASSPHVGPDRLTAHAERTFRGVEGLDGLTLHQAGRHAAACAALKQGASIEEVAGFLGNSVATAARNYIGVGTGRAVRQVLAANVAQVASGSALLAIGPGDEPEPRAKVELRRRGSTTWVAIEATRKERR